MIDFHTHILPRIDDGSHSEKESVEMLRLCKSQGANIVVATPHFYPERESVLNFLERRKKSKDALDLFLHETKETEENLPQILVGAEVNFYMGIENLKDIEELVLEGTNYMLIEMPFESFTKGQLDSLYRLESKYGITPIMAHIDRYIGYKGNDEAIDDLIRMGAMIQLNCEALLQMKTRGKCLKMISHGQIGLIGTDCHNLFSRSSNMERALKIIKWKLGSGEIGKIQSCGRDIIGIV